MQRNDNADCTRQLLRVIAAADQNEVKANLKKNDKIVEMRNFKNRRVAKPVKGLCHSWLSSSQSVDLTS